MDKITEDIKIEAILDKYEVKAEKMSPKIFYYSLVSKPMPDMEIPVLCFKKDAFDSFLDFKCFIHNSEEAQKRFSLKIVESSIRSIQLNLSITLIVKIKGEFYLLKDIELLQVSQEKNKIKHKDMKFAEASKYMTSFSDFFNNSESVNQKFMFFYFPSTIFEYLAGLWTIDEYSLKNAPTAEETIFATPPDTCYYVGGECGYACSAYSVCARNFECFESFGLTAKESFLEGVKKLHEDFVRDFLNFHVVQIFNERTTLEAENFLSYELSDISMAKNQEWIDILKAICDYIESTYSITGIERSKHELDNWDCNIESRYFEYHIKSRDIWNEGF